MLEFLKRYLNANLSKNLLQKQIHTSNVRNIFRKVEGR